MKTLARACIFALMLLLVQAQKSVSYVVGLPDTQLLPQYGNMDGKLVGYLPRLLQRFAADSGLQLKLKPLPIRRYVLEFTAGRLDFIVPANPAWGEGASTVPILFSDPIMQSRAGLIGLTPGIDPTRIKTITTLAGYTIAFLSAPNHPLKNAQVNFVNDVNGAMKVLASKRTDVIYLHYDAAREWIRTNSQIKTGMNSKPLVKFHFYDQYSEEFDYCLASIRHPAIIDAFNRWLRKHPGVLEEIRASMQASPDH